MLVAQKTQRQVVFCATKPPAMGPAAGPMSGARLYTLMALPRSSGLNMSDRVPPPMARGAEPPRPDRNRKAIIWPLV